MADLLGTKLVANEFVAFVKLTGEYKGVVDPRDATCWRPTPSRASPTSASIGIQLGGIGAMAPDAARRPGAARARGRCWPGFLATLDQRLRSRRCSC